MKPALFYTISRVYSSWEVFAVTSINEKHWHGRREDCGGRFTSSAHGKVAHLRGRFPSRAWAEMAFAGVRAIEQQRADEVRRLQKLRDESDKRFDDMAAAFIDETFRVSRAEGGEA